MGGRRSAADDTGLCNGYATSKSKLIGSEQAIFIKLSVERKHQALNYASAPAPITSSLGSSSDDRVCRLPGDAIPPCGLSEFTMLMQFTICLILINY